MNDLNKALGDISSIRRQVAHSTEFRGYGPATLASTGLLAVGGAGAFASGSVESHNGLLNHLDFDCRPVSPLNWDSDVRAHTPHSFRHGG